MKNKINNWLAFTCISPNKQMLTVDLYKACNQANCSILSSRSHVTGTMVATTAYVGGSWGAIAKLEAKLNSFAKKFAVKITYERTHELQSQEPVMSYNLQITAIDKNGIINGICEFLTSNKVYCEDITVYTNHGAHQTRMISLNIKAHLAETLHLGTFREQLMSYCDDHNLDLVFEPLRPT